MSDLHVLSSHQVDFSGELGGEISHVELGNLRRRGPVNVFHPGESLTRGGTIVTTFHDRAPHGHSLRVLMRVVARNGRESLWRFPIMPFCSDCYLVMNRYETRKSPIFNPNLESRTRHTSRPRIVRERF